MGSYYQTIKYLNGGASFYQPIKYLNGGASFYQPIKYFDGGMNGLRINTRKNSSRHTTKLSNVQINDLRKKLELFDHDLPRKEQYEKIDEILKNINEDDFDNEHDKMEIGILKGTISKMLEGKRGSKPYEFINILEKVLERLHVPRKNKVNNGGFYPSVMSGVVDAGRYLIPVALRQGYNLLNNKTRKNKKTLRKKHK